MTPSTQVTEGKPYRFVCRECGIKYDIDEHEDPTSSTGSCKCCGSSQWRILEIATGETVG